MIDFGVYNGSSRVYFYYCIRINGITITTDLHEEPLGVFKYVCSRKFYNIEEKYNFVCGLPISDELGKMLLDMFDKDDGFGYANKHLADKLHLELTKIIPEVFL